MRPVSTPGELTLTARVATPREFRPFGRLLRAGRTLRLGPARRTVLAVHGAHPASRRVTQLMRFPRARRAVQMLGTGGPAWLLVLPPDERPGVAPVAFLLPPEQVAVIQRGVWHAGPFPLKEATLSEAIEAPGAGHHVDQRALLELSGVEAVTVVLPDEPEGIVARFELNAPHAVLFDSALGATWRLGLLAIEGVEAARLEKRIVERLAAAAQSLVKIWPTPLAAQAQEPLRSLRGALVASGSHPDRTPSRLERLLALAAAGRPLALRDPLRSLGRLLTLQLRAPISLLDADALAEGVHARLGAAGERLERRGAGRLSLEGIPVLADRQGPLASPCGDAWRAEPGPATRRILLCAFHPAVQAASEASRGLQAAAEIVESLTAGKRGGSLLLGWPAAAQPSRN